MSEKHSTDELIYHLTRWKENLAVEDDHLEAIIARVRAADDDKAKADKLCEAAKTGLLYMDHTGPLYRDHVCGDPNSFCDADCAESAQWANDRECIRKAIAEYEEK